MDGFNLVECKNCGYQCWIEETVNLFTNCPNCDSHKITLLNPELSLL